MNQGFGLKILNTMIYISCFIWFWDSDLLISGDEFALTLGPSVIKSYSISTLRTHALLRLLWCIPPSRIVS